MSHYIVIVLFVVIQTWSALSFRSYGHDSFAPRRRRCEPITIPLCKNNYGINSTTYMPNQLNHETQEEAGLEVHQFWPLVKIQCSPDLRFFLCSIYTPICMDNYEKPVPACRSVCLRAKAGCEPLMQVYGFQWPLQLDCDQLPTAEENGRPCMDPQLSEKVTNTPSPRGGASTLSSNNSNLDKPHLPPLSSSTDDMIDYVPEAAGKDRSLSSSKCKCQCQSPLVRLNASNPLHSSMLGHVTTGGVPDCAMSCQSPYFSSSEQYFARIWVASWSAVCAFSTLITLFTFLIDMDRFSYPQKPIVYISICYLLLSTGYIVGLLAGREKVSCTEAGTSVYNSNGPLTCTIVFLLTYYFGMASHLWWLILCIAWFLSAGLKWGKEAISRYATCFHAFAWTVPLLKSVVALSTSSVDGDPTTGMCGIGNQNLNKLRGYVLAPMFIYICIGTSFLVIGFISLCRIRNVIKRQIGSNADKLERLMVRIGVFSFLYTVPAVIVIICLFYEQQFRENWEHQLTCKCSDTVGSQTSSSWRDRPDFSLHMLKHFMSLLVGIFSASWIWNRKTIDSYRGAFSRLCCRRNYTYTYPTQMGQFRTNHAYQPAALAKPVSMI